MSDGDRVAALERKVSELEATVKGLTEELVQANERIRQLEADSEADDAQADQQVTNGVADETADPGLVPGATDGSGGSDPVSIEDPSQEATPEDVRAAADTDKSDGCEGDDEEDSDDDIIVA